LHFNFFLLHIQLLTQFLGTQPSGGTCILTGELNLKSSNRFCSTFEGVCQFVCM